ncbi:hypothetical protein ACWCV5_35255 [Streptomyces tubercidicus]
MQTVKKTRGQMVSDNIWFSFAAFLFVSFLGFTLGKGEAWGKFAWATYFAGWVPPLGMLVWHAIRNKKINDGAPVIFGILAVFGVVCWLNHSDTFPL